MISTSVLIADCITSRMYRRRISYSYDANRARQGHRRRHCFSPVTALTRLHIKEVEFFKIGINSSTQGRTPSLLTWSSTVEVTHGRLVQISKWHMIFICVWACRSRRQHLSCQYLWHMNEVVQRPDFPINCQEVASWSHKDDWKTSPSPQSVH
jgi:hypothetical protein